MNLPAATSAYRDFPGRRWLGVLLRAAHLAGVVGLGAGLLGAEAADYDKISDTLDVWFDSGVSWAAVLERRAERIERQVEVLSLAGEVLAELADGVVEHLRGVELARAVVGTGIDRPQLVGPEHEADPVRAGADREPADGCVEGGGGDHEWGPSGVVERAGSDDECHRWCSA